MRKDTPFVGGETYHIFNRGAHKQAIFTNGADYERFLILLALANNEESIVVRDILRKYRGQTSVLFEKERAERQLVSVRAYCLMANHYHLLLQEKAPQGISRFMRKIMTGYSMYFNTKYKHSGVVAQGAFKSRHINNESYFRYIYSYIHLNPLEITHPDWKVKGIKDARSVRDFIKNYQYSSFIDYSVCNRPESSLLERDDRPDFLQNQNDIEELLSSFQTYSTEV